MELGTIAIVAVVLAILASFTISASAGLGGSLILVPTLAMIMGTKEGVALAAALLGANNMVKIVAYRHTLPFRSSAAIIGLLSLGAYLGASLLVAAPEALVGVCVLGSFGFTLLAERRGWTNIRQITGPLLAFGAGATSGFSGTSGPLKGAALRNLSLDRLHFVGAASLASLAGDVTKTAVFAQGSLLGADAARLLILSVPCMFAGTFLGRHVNHVVNESTFTKLFWSVMSGYSIRVGITLL